MTVRVIDHGYKAVLRRLTAAAKRPIVMTAGVHEQEGSQPHSGNTTVARVAEINELGLGTPAQPFVGPTFDEGRAGHQAMLERAAGELLTKGRGGVKKALRAEGKRLVKIMKKRCPVDTGKTRRSIKARVK